MTDSAPIRAPRGLGKAGRDLWKAVVADFDPSPVEARVLGQAAATLDVIASLEAQVEVDGVMVRGSQGQPVLHPAVAEARQQRQAFGRLLAQLDFEGDGESVVSMESARARKAAQARWRQPREARGA